MNTKCVIFDMDATLIDSADAITVTINFMRLELGLEPLEPEFVIQTINNPHINPIKEFYGFEHVSTNMRRIFDMEFDKNYALYARPYAEALELIGELRLAKCKLAVATNAPNSMIDSVLANCGLSEHFDYRLGASDLVPQKPDPTMLNLIKAKFSLPCCFVGDSLKDYMAAKNADMPYINVLWGRNDVIEGVPNCLNSKEVIKEFTKLNLK